MLGNWKVFSGISCDAVLMLRILRLCVTLFESRCDLQMNTRDAKKNINNRDNVIRRDV